LIASFHLIDRNEVLQAIGISERSLQRGEAAGKLLGPNASDRALRLALVTRQATDVLGSHEAAERWLSTPAIGLERRRPIELLQSSEGTDMVRTLLTRMEYGVYA
jgi:putative toxin-antitoxin system antitoxin component (TIGR02293 family)